MGRDIPKWLTFFFRAEDSLYNTNISLNLYNKRVGKGVWCLCSALGGFDFVISTGFALIYCFFGVSQFPNFDKRSSCGFQLL